MVRTCLVYHICIANSFFPSFFLSFFLLLLLLLLLLFFLLFFLWLFLFFFVLLLCSSSCSSSSSDVSVKLSFALFACVERNGSHAILWYICCRYHLSCVDISQTESVRVCFTSVWLLFIIFFSLSSNSLFISFILFHLSNFYRFTFLLQNNVNILLLLWLGGMLWKASLSFFVVLNDVLKS